MPRSAYPTSISQSERRRSGVDAVSTQQRTRLRRSPITEPAPDAHFPARSSARGLAVAQRRVRVALLIEEEGLERGAMTRLAGWLGVSLSTIARDVKALLAAGHPIVVAAAARANRHRENGFLLNGA